MRVPVGVKVGVFSIAVMGGYSWFANSIPQIESKPPQELSLEGGNVTPAQLVKAGEEIYHTKGTCEICHRIGQKGTRAPDLGGVGARAAKAKPGMSAKAYLLESLMQPQRVHRRGLSADHAGRRQAADRAEPLGGVGADRLPGVAGRHRGRHAERHSGRRSAPPRAAVAALPPR